MAIGQLIFPSTFWHFLRNSFLLRKSTSIFCTFSLINFFLLWYSTSLFSYFFCPCKNRHEYEYEYVPCERWEEFKKNILPDPTGPFTILQPRNQESWQCSRSRPTLPLLCSFKIRRSTFRTALSLPIDGLWGFKVGKVSVGVCSHGKTFGPKIETKSGAKREKED